MQLHALVRSGLVALGIAGAGAIFVVLGFAGVAMRAQCAPNCGGPVDTIITGAVDPGATEPQPSAAAPGLTVAAKSTVDPRLAAADKVLGATFDMLIEPVQPKTAVARAAAVPDAAVEPVVAAVEDDESVELARRTVRSVRVSADGQPMLADDAVIAEAANRAQELASGQATSIAAVAPAAAVEPLAFTEPIPPAAEPVEVAAVPEAAVPGDVAPVEDAAPVPLMRPKKFAAQARAAAPAATPEPQVAEAAPAPKRGAQAGDTRTVLGAGVNVRATASSSGNKLFALGPGERVSVLDSERGWLKVTDDQGRTGWVYKDYVSGG